LPFSTAYADREQNKFVECPTGETAVRVCVANPSTAPVEVTGTISATAAAPTGPIKRSVATATDSAADPIPVPLTNRVAVSIRNKSATETVYLGEDGTITPDNSATGGWEIGPGEDFNLDLSDSNGFFLITEPGKTALVKFLEIASSAAGGGMSGTSIQENLSGVVDGVNAVFTASQSPLSPGSFNLYVNGIHQSLGVHYTRTGVTVTMIAVPEVGQVVDAAYTY
jgi:hypothetical protein